MPEYRYLIVGGGMTADAAVEGIRKVDLDGTIGLISSESHPPYNRPPLSKGLWKGDSVEDIWRSAAQENAELHLSTMVERIDPAGKQVTDNRGVSYSYDKLLLATGGLVRKLPWDVPGVIYYRTFDDYQKLRALADSKKTFAVIGGGFIGSEVAAALSMNGKTVSLIFPGETIGGNLYPSGLANHLNAYYQSKGVAVCSKRSVTNLAQVDSGYRVTTDQGDDLQVDGVVAGIGIEPNITLAKSIGLTIDNGVIVDEYMRTSHPAIFAAGDIASFYNPALDRRMRVEHEDNAVDSGKVAGRNMAGDQKRYDHLPFFYSDLFDLGYEAVGEIDARLEVVEDWQEEFRTGVIYYLKEGQVRGVLLWGIFGKIKEARALIAEQRPRTAGELRGRIKP